jgi:hypothetical protein
MNQTPQWYATKSAGNHQGIVADEQTGKTIAITYEVEHAAYIVQAVNAHADLVAVCQLLMKAEPMQAGERNGCIMGTISQAIDKARAALTLATKED